MRIKWIDCAKGIAMICIIIGHIGGGTYGKIYLSFVHVFHVVTFFLLSGYTFKIEPITSEYVNKKFRRLMKPYFYTCCAVILMDIFNSIFLLKDGRILTISNILAKDIIRSFFASGTNTNFAGIDLGTRIGAIWFLPAMFFSLIIVQWILNRYVEEWKRWAIVIIIGLFGYISSSYIWLPFSIQSGMTASVFILAGYYVKEYSVLERLKWFHYLIFLSIFILGVYKGYDHFYLNTNYCSDLIISIFMAFAGSFLLLKLAKHGEKISILSFIGEHSLLVLCVHLVAIETMGQYFNYIINFMGITGDVPMLWGSLVLNIIFAIIGTFIILFFFQIENKISRTAFYRNVSDKRDYSADIMKGILIVSMLVGHSVIDTSLRRIIYSCHMVAFIFLSGYFYHPVKSLGTGIIRLYKSFLIPYGVFCLAHLILHLGEINSDNLFRNLKTYILAMSFSGKLFVDIPSIGPIYFICMLFLVRIIYLFIDYFTNSIQRKIAIVMMLSLGGFILGNGGYWLPWSLDCALYCLIFYEIGIACRRLNILEYVSRHSAFYFIFSIIWAYMIYTSSMEIAVRKYTPYGLVIFGALSGILLLYMLSRYISVNMRNGIINLLKKSGENTLYVIIVHELLGGYIYSWAARYLRTEDIYHMIVCICVQILLGIMIGIIVKKLKNKSFLEIKV